MKITHIILFTLFFIIAAYAKVTMELVNPDFAIQVDPNTKRYAPKILEILFTYEAEDDVHPGFNISINSLQGSIVTHAKGIKKILLPAFYGEPETDTVITISFNVTILDPFFTGMGTVPVLDSYTVNHNVTVPFVSSEVPEESLTWLTTGDGLKTNSARNILKLEDGTLIIQQNGITTYLNGAVEVLDTTNGLGNSFMSRFKAFKDGLIFSDNSYVRYYDGVNWKLTPISDLNLKYVNFNRAIIDSLWGKTWLDKSGGGVCVYDGENWQQFDTSNGFPSMDDISFIAPDGLGGVWIKYNNHPAYTFAHFNGSNWKSYELYEKTGYVYSFNFTSDLNGGFYVCNGNEDKILHFKDDSLSDITGDLIDGTVEFRELKIYPDGHGGIWYLFQDSGSVTPVLTHKDVYSDTIKASIEHKELEYIYYFYPVDKNRFWAYHTNSIDYYASVSYYDGSQYSHFTAPDDLIDDKIDQFVVKNNKAWISYKDTCGISYYDGSGWFYINKDNGFPEYPISEIFPVAEDEAWATFKSGLGMIRIPASLDGLNISNAVLKERNIPIAVRKNRIIISSESQIGMELRLLNLKGQSIYKTETTLKKGNNVITIPKEHAKGLYLLSVKIGKRSFTFKIVHNM